MLKRPWQKKEKRDSKDFGGSQMPKSGGSWWKPGDIKTEKFLIDSKLSKHNRFSVTKDMWSKIFKEALLNRRLPLLSIKFSDEDIELVILSKEDFLTIIGGSDGFHSRSIK